MRKIHVLPGDALVERFKESGIEGEIVVCRECLIEGSVKTESLEEFWRVRAKFIAAEYGETEKRYFREVAAELQKLENLSPADEVNLWFENELFCQANMWFCLYLLRNSTATIYRVLPVALNDEEIWKGFGDMSAEDLRRCFAERIKFTGEDIALGANLWRAFQNSDHEKLEKLAQTESVCFPHLKEVCRAATEKEFRPRQILREIAAAGANDFEREIFPEFVRRAGVYGFGDAQVQRLVREL